MKRAACLAALALAGTAAHAETLPARVEAGFERIDLPGGERLGLLHVSELVEFSPGWWAGPALHGAASGSRGGLFTWGAELQGRWKLGDRLSAGAGLYLGAGGGAAAPVGGGLMLRPALMLDYDFGGWRAGVSASQVRFPSGSDIRSSQLGLYLAWDHQARFAAPRALQDEGGGIGIRQVGAVLARYAKANDAGSMGLVGARLGWPLTPNVTATFDLLGAASGGADGYAEFTGGVQAMWPVVGNTLSLGAHLQAGLGGGGAVPTGAGPLGKASVAAALTLGEWTATLQGGRVRAFDGDLDSSFTQLSVQTSIGDPGAPLRDSSAGFTVQRWQKAARKTGGDPGITVTGLVFRRQLGSGHWYGSAQAHGAATGGAGAFSVGLLGLGLQARPLGGWHVGAELSAGAAGGGGIDNGGGALAQAMVWTGVEVGRYSRVELSLGAIKSAKGELSTPMAGLTWNVAFGLR